MQTVTAPPPGRFVIGLGQALAVWLAVVLVVLLLADAAVAVAAFGAGVLFCLVIGVRHRRRSRADSAVGTFAGVILWPLLIGVALAVINIASSSMSAVE